MSRIISTSASRAFPLGDRLEREAHSATVDYFERRGISLSQVDTRGWLVRLMPPVDSRLSVLGCVEERDDEFELMELEGGFRWSTHPSLHAAVVHLLRDPRVSARVKPVDSGE